MRQVPPDKVIFRYWDGAVIALFPEIATDPNPYHCSSYMHIGQHGAADPVLVIRNSRPATLKEYLELAQELSQRGYRLDVRHRLPSDAIETRRQQLARVGRVQEGRT